MLNVQIDNKLSDEVPILKSNSQQSLIPWLKENQNAVKECLVQDGGIILRGFLTDSEDSAESVLSLLGSELLDDAYWSTPRTGVSKKTFTATEYPKEKTIALHSEMAYMPVWPRLVAFHSLGVADAGGETTLCNIDKFSEAVSHILPEFLKRGVLYKRTFHPNIDIPWQKAFQTDDPKQVKRIADKIGMQIKWLRDGVLQTTHLLHGCVLSEDEKPLWFNQSHVFHTANLPNNTLKDLIDVLGVDELPRASFYGDGTPIADEIIETIKEKLEEYTIKVPWEIGDVLVIDNMRYSHGRMPFEGSRKLHVAMADSYSLKKRETLFSTNNHNSSTLKKIPSKIKSLFSKEV